MKRRSFLTTASLAGAAGSLPLAFAGGARAATAPRARLLRAAHAQAGTPFLAPGAEPCDDCGTATVRVHLDGLRRAPGSSLRGFELAALFDQPRMPSAPYLAWSFTAGTPERRSMPSSFIAGRATLRALELTLRSEGADACRERCELTRFEAPLLAPGHYVVVLDAPAVPLHHGGLAAAPLGDAGFDYFAFRVTAAG